MSEADHRVPEPGAPAVRYWMGITPEINAVRPGACPHCRALSRAHDGRVVLEGHGARRRDVVVVVNDGALRFERIACWSRRFLCNACGRCCAVLPDGVLPGSSYSLAAVIVAWFAASATMGDASSRASAVCAPEGADRSLPEATASRWRTPYRWARRLDALLPTLPPGPGGWREGVERLLCWLLPRGGALSAEAMGRAGVYAHSVAHGRRGTAF